MFTDIFIKRPVLASVISLLIFMVGLRAFYDLPLREFPKLENTVITVTTPYVGASADLIQGFITSPLEKSIAGADGVDYITAESMQNASVIRAYIRLNYDPEKAFTNVMSKVSEVKGQLPSEAENPVIIKDTGNSIALMYMSFNSEQMTPEQITEYVSRVIQPQLSTLEGVASAKLLGQKQFAMRVWLNPRKMAALSVSAEDVIKSLRTNNFIAAAGNTKGLWVATPMQATTTVHSLDEFRKLVVKQKDQAIIRLENIANVELGAKDYDSLVTFNGKQAIFIGIYSTPSANPLQVIQRVRQAFPALQKGFPPGLKAKIVYDATDYIRASLHEVVRTIVEATLIVVLVVFLFLGNLRSVIIPVVAIPLSLIGVCTLMLMLGYSLNLLTLLAMVLAIGLVVDDAIVVVENVYRHMEEGMSAFNAALHGAREIATPIISMTVTLAAVYAPIGFMGGLTGALFKEFAFTLASSVIISGVIALTLSPMLCSRLLKPLNQESGFSHRVENFFLNLKHRYLRLLHSSIQYRPVTLLFAVTVLFSCYYFYTHSQQQLAPDEDQSILFMSATAPKSVNIDYVTHYSQEFNKIFSSHQETQDYFIISGEGAVNNVIAGILLKPWDQRKLSQAQLSPAVQQQISQIAGLQSVVFPLPSLPVGGDGLPIQFVLTTTGDYSVLYQTMEKLKEAAGKSGLFIFTDSSLKFDNPQLNIEVNRSKAAELGVDMQTVASALSTLYGGNYTNRFNLDGRAYEVIPQVGQEFRLTPQQITQTYIKTLSGKMISLGTIAQLSSSTQPNSLSEFQQLNSATLQGMMMPGKTIGEGLQFLENTASKIMPLGMSYNFAGQSRDFISEGNTLVYTLFFSIIIIFLVLAAQFESFKDPFVILVSVPMSIGGALLFTHLGFASVNIYTQIGLVTLVGLISKHGILMVDFAKKLRLEKNVSARLAIEEAAGIRLRPILMTTAAMFFGVLPLVFAKGAGAASRYNIGLVIATGISIGTLFTLFVLPTIYLLVDSISLRRIWASLILGCLMLGLGIGIGISASTMLFIIYLVIAAFLIFQAYTHTPHTPREEQQPYNI